VLEQHLQAAIQHLSIVAKQVTAPRVNFKATLEGWINVNGPSDYNLPHTTPAIPGRASTTPAPDRACRTARRAAASSSSTRARDASLGPKEGLRHSGSVWISPFDGMLLIFPSYLEHYVHPYLGSDERITPAFNSLVEELTPLP
jgi:Putative 2OG-Fe(II) oxygenase